MLIYIRRNIYFFICILAGLCFLYSNFSHAEETGFEKLRKESSKIKTLQADFTQKKFMKILSRPLVSQGNFYYAAPDSLRWEYLKPLHSIVISHKNTSRRYIYSDGKMIEDKNGGAQVVKIVLNDVSGWISGRFDRNPSFKAQIREGADTTVTLIPAAKNMAGMIEKIEIDISRKTATVKSVKIIEDRDTYTQINFQNMKINKEVPPSVFQDIK